MAISHDSYISTRSTGVPLFLPPEDLPLSLEQFLDIAPAIAAELARLHHQGKLHRRISPCALNLASTSSDVRILEPDALAADADRLHILPYLSPEQTGRMNRQVDERADLYALGATFYELLIGRPPFQACDELAWVHAHVTRTPQPLTTLMPDLPPLISDIVMRLLAKMPEDRYQSGNGLRYDLERARQQWKATGSITAFPLGERDHLERLTIPEALAGRDEELRTLQRAFERVATDGTSELVLVSGAAGIGKSSLVAELQQRVVEQHGFFLSAPCDPSQQHIPYAALAQALRSLVRHILIESEDRLAIWQQHVQAALGMNGQVMLDLLPDLELIIGPQPAVATLGPAEAQNRFHLVFQRFLCLFAHPETPLVLVLDGVQHADVATLTLLQNLLSGDNLAATLAILTYRDDEVDEMHALPSLIQTLTAETGRVTELALMPLDQGAVTDLIAATLHRSPHEVEPLAQIALTRTSGSPFFLCEFLNLLHQNQLLTFDQQQGTWHWESQAIAAQEIQTNVLDVLITRIEQLPDATRTALQAAACIGMCFDAATLAALTSTDAHRDLEPAINAGLLLIVDGEQVVPTSAPLPDHTYYRFPHERIQQAVYALIDERQRRQLHQHIGRFLLTHEQSVADPFTIVNQFLHSDPSTITDKERDTLIQVSLRAGRKARDAAAHAAARSAFALAVDLLTNAEDAWETQEHLMLESMFGLAESTYMTGDFERAEALFVTMLERTTSDLDKADIYAVRLKLYQVAGRYNEGVSLAIDALRMFDVVLPEGDDATYQAALVAELEAIPHNMGERQIADLLHAPVATNPTHKAIIKLLMNLAPCAYIGRPAIFPIVGLKQLNASLVYGNTPDSCFAYSVYALMLVSVFQDIPSAYAFSEMSLQLNERFQDITLRGTLLHLHGDHINFWRNHIASDIPILERAFPACLEAGDLVYSGFIAFEIVWQFWERGDTLDDVLTHAQPYAAFAQQVRNAPVAETIRLEAQFVRNLQGKTHSNATLNDDHFDEVTALNNVTAASFGCGIIFYHIIRQIIHYTYGRWAEALQATDDAVPTLGAAMAMPIEATYAFYAALTVAALYPHAGTEEQERFDAILETQHAKLTNWAEHSPATFGNRAMLVAAERARLAGNDLEAMRLYDQAVQSAHTHGFIQYEALAYECAGRFYLERDFEIMAWTYLYEARTCYEQWGAHAKVQHLDTLYPQLGTRQAAPLADTPTVAKGAAHAPNAAEALAERFDLLAVIKASQALSGEIVLDRLLDRLLTIVMEHTGARNATFVITERDRLIVGAEAHLQTETIQVQVCDERLEPTPDRLPLAILHYVRRTRELLVLDDAPTQALFATDPYITEVQPQSILCMPIIRQTDLLGLLYLENRTLTGAFSRERITVLELLATQAAISLEHATLYTTLEQRTAEQLRAEEERARMQEQMIEVQKAALRELSTPLLPIADHVLVLPLIGTLDSYRAQQIMETLLEGVARQHATVVIIDITGVSVVDTHVASALIQVAQAVRLLGATVLMTGIGPTMAQTMVNLGLDFDTLTTLSSLQAGIGYALTRN